ncbi:Cytochrome c oxidase subunit 5B, mitochondrial [Paramarasmius palmivorus]|uniref:Cytochrome c oxidase subunit 5B, mitochondrial n=1 Tax=Paramarasmius palmivorus TaxID=297713 RepID=A0AAW0BWQ9_9AGAR
MQAAALRLARQSASLPLRRCLATTANPAHVASASTSSPSPTKPKQAIIPISNIEAQWEKMSLEEKMTVQEQLEETMKKDWKELSLDEKKASYYVAFGPHGPRAPISKPGDNLKIFACVVGLVGVTGVISALIRAGAPEAPKTMSKEWQEATNERALEQKMNPITGISSEGYKGKGFVSESK